MESYFLYCISYTIYEGNDNKDIVLAEFNRKLTTTWIDKESDVMEAQIIKDYNKRQRNKKYSQKIRCFDNEWAHVSSTVCNVGKLCWQNNIFLTRYSSTSILELLIWHEKV